MHPLTNSKRINHDRSWFVTGDIWKFVMDDWRWNTNIEQCLDQLKVNSRFGFTFVQTDSEHTEMHAKQTSIF